MRSPRDRPSRPHRARAAIDALAGLVYPALCLGCERRLPGSDKLPICPSCLLDLPRAPDGVAAACLRACGAPDGINGGPVLWRFDAGNTVRRVQHALKYGGYPSIGVPLGELIAQARDPNAPHVDVVMPVPLSRVRLLERGYNQAATLAEGVASRLGAPARTDILVRSRPTRSQTRLSQEERIQNVSGAFDVRGVDTLDGVHVLLVDDVLTTGATLSAAARPLAELGATVEVSALSVAGQ